MCKEKIYDESGLVIGEAAPIGEQRPETEFTDIDLDILDDEVLPTSGIKVEEHSDTISRNAFCLEYLLQRENSNVRIHQCWQ